MGKFSPKKIGNLLKKTESMKQVNIRRILRSKKLLQVLKRKGVRTDGILLFGSHKGKKLSQLLNEFDSAPYVLNYLLQNVDLPSSFRKKVQEIINYQVSEENVKAITFMQSEVIEEGILNADDDIPW